MGLLLALFAALIVYILWARTRRSHVVFDVPADASIDTLKYSIAGLTWGRVCEGNRVTIVQDSTFFDALLDDVAKATHHVHLESFLWQNGKVSERIASALSDCARRGMEVRVMVDHRGAITTSGTVWAAMRSAGVDFRVYHRARFREMGWYNTRDHRKIAVIDGRIGYTFGHGIADMWSADDWRDTAARFEGPVVGELQAAFLDNWIKVNRRGLVGEAYFPKLEYTGTTDVHVAYAAPPETSSAVRRLYHLAIASAKSELILQNPYFIPDRYAVRLCADAVARGVAVRLMLPTSETSDFPIVQHASHAYYGALLCAGATIHEYARSGLHQKVMIVDRTWCTIGSANFDPRSFNINDEITVAIYDTEIAQELAAAFESDLAHALPWTLARWKGRGAWHRVVDRASVLLKRQL